MPLNKETETLLQIVHFFLPVYQKKISRSLWQKNKVFECLALDYHYYTLNLD